MKNYMNIYLKKIFLLLICVSSFLLLASCGGESIKKNGDTIEYNGVVYKELKKTRTVSINVTDTKIVYEVRKNEILSLDDNYERLYYDFDKELLGYKEHDESPIVWYCPVEKHEEYSKSVNYSPLDRIKFEYYEYDEYDRPEKEFSYFLDDKTVELIDSCVEKNSQRVYDDNADRDIKVIRLKRCNGSDTVESHEELYLYQTPAGDYGVIVRKEQKQVSGNVLWLRTLISFGNDKENLVPVFEKFDELGGAYTRLWLN